MIVVKLFGLPRTCTNVMEVALRTNFKNLVIWTNFPCWKHGKNTHKGRVIKRAKQRHHPAIDTDDLKFIVCTKNPYDWLVSLYNFEVTSKQQDKSFDDFLRSPTWHYRNEKNHSDPISKFNTLTHHWLTMFDDPSAIQQVKSEDMRKNQVALLTQLEKAFGLTRQRADLSPVEKRIAPGAKMTKENFKKKEMNFSKKQIAFINSRLDRKTLKVAKYRLR
jgi:hypothetical protein